MKLSSTELHPQLQALDTATLSSVVAVGLVKGDRPIPGVVLLSPLAVQKLTDRQIQVFVQRSYAAHTSYTDMDYANAGADIIDDFQTLAQMSNILIKFSPFTLEELRLLKTKQIILSRVVENELSLDYFNLLKDKLSYAIAINLIKTHDDNNMIDSILMSSPDSDNINRRLEAFILPLVETIALSNNLRALIQTNPPLLQSMYCYEGILCNKNYANSLNTMWKDILSLCFDLN